MPTYANYRYAWSWVIFLHRLGLSNRPQLVILPTSRPITSVRQQLFDSRKFTRGKLTFEKYWLLCDATKIETNNQLGQIYITKLESFYQQYESLDSSNFDRLIKQLIAFMMSNTKVKAFDDLNLEPSQQKAIKDFLSFSPELQTAIVETTTIIIRKK